jgi:hypothetical protein
MLANSTAVCNALKFVHVVAAIVRVVAGLFFLFHSTGLRRADDPTNLAPAEYALYHLSYRPSELRY